MARSRTILLILVLGIIPSLAAAQAPPPGATDTLVRNLHALPPDPAGNAPTGPYPDQLWTLRPYKKVGYAWMRYNVALPDPGADFADPAVPWLTDIDLEMQDGEFWVGFVGLELQPFQTLTLFGEIGGNAPRDVTFDMQANGAATRPTGSGLPGSGANMVSPWTYTGRDFTWWIIDAGGSWWFTDTTALEAGVKIEHKDYELVDPRNRTLGVNGQPPTQSITCNRI